MYGNYNIKEFPVPNKNSKFNFAVKSMEENGAFSGYASVFGIVDSQNDLIMKGAFSNTLKKRGGEVRLLWQHQVDEPIGVFALIREDSHGLYVEGKLLLDLQRGSEAYSLLKNGAINGLSIGYTVKSAGYSSDHYIRLINEVELWEISLVTFPANEGAVVTSVKNQESGKSKNQESGILESRNKNPYSIPDGEGVLYDSGIIDSLDRAIKMLA